MGETAKRTDRGIAANKLKAFTECIEKESYLRLKWFRKNEERLVAYIAKPNSRTVPTEVVEKVKKDRQERYQNAERITLPKIEDKPPLIDPEAYYKFMKPVNPAHRKLLFSGTQKDGRLNYLNKRIKILPEDRYYFPETSSYMYGWQMFHSSKTATPVRYGTSYVIQGSFYRRNGVGRDPDWYQEPASLSTCICGRI